MHIRLNLLSLLAAIWLLSACKVQEFPKDATYTFNNNTGQPVTLDVYNTQDDYTNNSNRVSRTSIAPGKNAQMTFGIGNTVWVDWYTADYSLSNWHNNKRIQKAGGQTLGLVGQINIAAMDDQINLAQSFGYTDTSRIILLNGSGSSSTWEMNIPSGVGSAYAGKHRFVFSKDFTCKYTYTSTFGGQTNSTLYGMISQLIPYKPTRAGGFTMSFYNDEFFRNLILRADFNTGSSWSSTINRDTLSAYLYNAGSSGYYPLVRQ